jgi:hypothetical protein
MGGTGGDGPWKVVQKQRRSKKISQSKNFLTAEGKGNNIPVNHNEVPASNNSGAKISGSRFVTLSDNDVEINEEDMEREGMNVSNDSEVETLYGSQQNGNKVNAKSVRSKRGSNMGTIKKGEVNHEKGNKDQKLATRGGGSFKGKTGSQVKKGVENLADMMGTK